MLRSMDSAISGMQAFQTKLDVIGNNIANVDTVGFKSGRADFSDILSQTMAGASGANVKTSGGTTTIGMGGTNPKQVGLGVQVSAIQTLFTQGATSTTGNPTDLNINGSGLFVVSPDNGSTLFYTRAGNFNVDAKNDLVLPDGKVAYGFDASTTGTGVTGLNTYTSTDPTKLKPLNLTAMVNSYQAYIDSPDATPATTDPNGFTHTNSTTRTFQLSTTPDVQIGMDGAVSANVIVSGQDAQGNPITTPQTMRLVLGHVALATFANPGGLSKTGDSQYQVSANSGSPTYMNPGADGSGTNVQAGALEMSNVDLTEQFSSMIVAQRGFDANSKMIGTDNAILQDVVNLKNS